MVPKTLQLSMLQKRQYDGARELRVQRRSSAKALALEVVGTRRAALQGTTYSPAEEVTLQQSTLV